jgi:hypothetical protein
MGIRELNNMTATLFLVMLICSATEDAIKIISKDCIGANFIEQQAEV